MASIIAAHPHQHTTPDVTPEGSDIVIVPLVGVGGWACVEVDPRTGEKVIAIVDVARPDPGQDVHSPDAIRRLAAQLLALADEADPTGATQ